MKKTVYPIMTFVTLQLVSSASLVLWIIWYVVKTDEYESIAELTRKTYVNSEFSQHNGPSLVLGIIFLSLIIITSSLIFIEWLKAKMRYKNGSDFISGFTHELMTPLTCIQMNLEAATGRSTISEEKKEKLLRTAFAESKKLQRSIDKILEIKVIEHRKNLLQLDQLFVATFFNDYFAGIIKEYPEINLALNIDCHEKTYIKADPNALGVVLNNLIENAIKYSIGEIKINITLSEKNRKLKIVFQDFGIGIQGSKLKKVFKIFYRDNINKRGSGLGLYISKQIIKKHKGKIEAASPGPGQGTTLFITLPCKRLYE